MPPLKTPVTEVSRLMCGELDEVDPGVESGGWVVFAAREPVARLEDLAVDWDPAYAAHAVLEDFIRNPSTKR